MKHLSTFAVVAALLTLAGTAGSTVGSQTRIFVSNYENILGTSMELKIGASSRAEAQAAEAAVLSEISRESKLLSAWDTDSEFSRWSRTQNEPVHISPELLEVLGLYDQWRGKTNGALDASAETVIRTWKSAAKEGRVPTRDELAAAVARVRQSHWSIDAKAQSAIHLTNVPLVLASFTKSYIIDRALSAAMGNAGVHRWYSISVATLWREAA